jgi:hypothetical protein
MALTTNVIEDKVATTTWLGEHLLPKSGENGIQNKILSKVSAFTITYEISPSGKVQGPGNNWITTLSSFTCEYSFSHVINNYAVFMGTYVIGTTPCYNMYLDTLIRNIGSAVFIPLNITLNSSASEELLLAVKNDFSVYMFQGVGPAYIPSDTGTEVYYTDNLFYYLGNLYHNNCKVTPVSITITNSNQNYITGGIAYGNNCAYGNGDGKLISGLDDYNYHAVRKTEYFDMFGVSYADSKCIKETETSNINTHIIRPVVGKIYQTYDTHANSTEQSAAYDGLNYKIIPPHTLGYWYYNSDKKYNIMHHIPFTSAVFDSYDSAFAFKDNRIYYINELTTSDDIRFSNIHLHNKQTVNASDLYANEYSSLNRSMHYFNRPFMYSGCYFRPAANSDKVATIDLTDIDRFYIIDSNTTTKLPELLAPSILNTGNTVNNIYRWNVVVNDINLMTKYYHPTLSSLCLNNNTANNNLRVTQHDAKLGSVPVIHVPSMIKRSSTDAVTKLTLSKYKLNVTFNLQEFRLYDAAYADIKPNGITRLNSLVYGNSTNNLAIDNINGLLNELNNAEYKIVLTFQNAATDTESQRTITKTFFVTGLYEFIKTSDNPLVLTGVPPTAKTYDLTEYADYSGADSYIWNIKYYVYMLPTKHFVYDEDLFNNVYTPVSDYPRKHIGNYSSLAGTAAPAPSNPSGRGVAMEIGEYDE